VNEKCMLWNGLELPINPYYQDDYVTIYNMSPKEAKMNAAKKVQIIPVYYVPPPSTVVEAVKGANKPRITIIKGHSIR